jgi:2,4-dienoyl-CoA reductase-like NADH-dependent reductase (Old Yellow Enzyme family)
MITSRSFLREIEDFLKRTGMNATAFGRAVANDPSLVGELRRGRSPRLDLVERVHAFMTEHDRDCVGNF